MPLHDYLPLFLFVIVSTITPGGATTLATASGAHFGYRRSLPYVAGIAVALASMAAAAAVGLGSILMALPALVVIVAGSRLLAITPPSVARTRLSGSRADGAPGAATWYAAYVVLGAAGAAFGWWSFDALS